MGKTADMGERVHPPKKERRGKENLFNHPPCASQEASPSQTRPPLQGVSGMEGAAEDSVGGGAEGDREADELVDGPGSAGRREIWASGAGLPLLHRCGKAGATSG